MSRKSSRDRTRQKLALRDSTASIAWQFSTQEPFLCGLFSAFLTMFFSSRLHTVHSLPLPLDWQDGSSKIRGVDLLRCTVPRPSPGSEAFAQTRPSRPEWDPVCRPEDKQNWRISKLYYQTISHRLQFKDPWRDHGWRLLAREFLKPS